MLEMVAHDTSQNNHIQNYINKLNKKRNVLTNKTVYNALHPSEPLCN